MYEDFPIIDNLEDLQKYLKSMNKGVAKVTIDMLPPSGVIKEERFCFIKGIKDTVYSALNSKSKDKEEAYPIIKLGTSYIYIATKKNIKLPYNYPKVEGLQYLEKRGNLFYFSIDKKYCYKTNFYTIVVTQKEPELHYGSIKILCYEGSFLYVSAVPLKNLEAVSRRTYYMNCNPDFMSKALGQVYNIMSTWVVPKHFEVLEPTDSFKVMNRESFAVKNSLI